MARKKESRRLEEIERLIKEIAEAHKRTEEAVARTSRDVGNLTNGMGQMSEDLLAPSLPRILEPLGIAVHGYSLRARRRTDGDTIEIDVLGNGEDRERRQLAIVVEIKLRLTQKHVDEFLREKIRGFRRAFPEYESYGVIGVVGGLTVREPVARYAEKKGLVVLAPGDEVARSLNRPAFRPRVWEPERSEG